MSTTGFLEMFYNLTSPCSWMKATKSNLPARWEKCPEKKKEVNEGKEGKEIAEIKPNRCTAGSMKRIPFHLHVQKSGGSLACAIAMRANPSGGFLHPKSSKNHGCNLPGDGPGTIFGAKSASNVFANRGWDDSKRFGYAKKQQPAFIAREMFISLPMNTELFIYSIFLRDPLKRMLSGMAFSSHSWADVLKWTTKSTFNDPRNNKNVWCLGNGTPPYNNFFTRILGGEVVYLSPLGSMTNTHFEIAMRNLKKIGRMS